MKIAIINFQFAANHGAVLQCYAMQTYLLQKGHEVEIINYRPAYHMEHFKPQNTLDRERLHKFEGFRKRNFRYTKLYKSFQELVDDPPHADAYLAGSDQLWNNEILDGRFDEAYFLRFGSDNTRRITYAVSLNDHYTDSEWSRLAQLTEKIECISVRESVPAFEQLTGKAFRICVDPTLLLVKDDYAKIEKPYSAEASYLFVYGVEYSTELEEAARHISAELGVRLLNGCPHRLHIKGADELYVYGPDEFLGLIQNAVYVVTNSLHGAIFSIIYRKSFSIASNKCNMRRLHELLKKTCLTSRFLYCGNPYEPIDYHQVDEKLQSERSIADRYLQTALRGDSFVL